MCTALSGRSTLKLEEPNANLNKKIFADSGLNSNKHLRNYDCWEEDLAPEDWINICKAIEGEQGYVPTYNSSKQYTWSGVKVLSYSQKHNKFIVQIIETGI